jgi:rod shape-determining protein MreD
MSRPVIVVFMIILCAVLQIGMPCASLFANAKAPFLAAVVVYYGASGSMATACSVAVAAGLIHDAMSPIPLGYSVLVFGLLALLSSELRRVVDMDQWIARWIMGLLAGASTTVFFGVLLSRHGLVECGPGALTARVIGTALMGMPLVPLVYATASGLHRLTSERA